MYKFIILKNEYGKIDVIGYTDNMEVSLSIKNKLEEKFKERQVFFNIQKIPYLQEESL